MAAVFGRDVRIRDDNSTLTFLVVGAAQLCEKVANSVYQSAREQNKWATVHQCEVINQAVKDELLLTTDFIILIINAETSHSVLEAEENLNNIDKNFLITGAVFFVYCHAPTSYSNVIHQRSRALADKYCIRRILNVNIYDKKNCQLLGQRVLNLSHGILNLRSGRPNIDFSLIFSN